jgi:hypothetical protein
MKKAEKASKRSLARITTWLGHPICNANIKSFYSIIQLLEVIACFFRNNAN